MESQLPLPDPGYRRFMVFRRGNAVGVIDVPDIPGELPHELRGELWKVKIGVVDEELARSAPYPKEDFDGIIEDLKQFLERDGVM
jgi:hypothetical protein